LHSRENIFLRKVSHLFGWVLLAMRVLQEINDPLQFKGRRRDINYFGL
jgi:hypothetical protein